MILDLCRFVQVIKRNFEEQHRRMSTMERTVDKMG